LTESENPIETPWSPLVGDHIQIVATGAPGVVMDINKSWHFVVAVYSPVLRAVTTAPHRTFTLREIGPTSAPPAADPAALAAPRRGARQNPPAE
jgi:hypothetical protein